MVSSVGFVDCPVLGSFAVAGLLADSLTVKVGRVCELCCGDCVVMSVTLELVELVAAAKAPLWDTTRSIT